MQLAERLGRVPGVTLLSGPFFNEFTLDLGRDARTVVRALAEKGVLGGVSGGRLWAGEKTLANALIVAVTETATDEDFDAFEDALDEVMG